MPDHPRPGRRRLASTAAVSLLSGVLISAATPAASAATAPTVAKAAPTAPNAAPVPVSHPDIPASKLAGPLAHARGTQSVFVRLSGSGAAKVSRTAAAKAGGSSADKQHAATSAALTRRAQVENASADVVRTAQRADASAQRLYTVSNAVPGVALRADGAAVRAIAARPDVVSIAPITPHTLSNASAAQLTRVLATWQNTHNYGSGVTVGVIDTGLDYTHADFGGRGTAGAYNQAYAKPKDPNWLTNSPALAKAKIAGGYDFVGNNYNADPDSPDYQPVPHPDPAPLDCNEHGTHVSGTAAGYGVTAAGDTFTGRYGALDRTKLYNMKIGPGMAPEAKLYPLRVFGCEGSTDIVIAALDRALDPNQDGNFTDHLDVVNLSLGSDYGPADDPENAVVDEIAANGVLPVISMGNNGDLTDTGGAPGTATRSLTVASTVDEFQLRDGLRVNAPAGVAGVTAGQNSVAYDYSTHPAPVTGDVVSVTGDVSTAPADPADGNADGCEPFSAAAADRADGKVVWLEWDDNDATRRCGSATRSGNAKAAGAIGSVFTSELNVFGAGITGDEDIPVFQFPKAGTDKFRSSVDHGLNVTFDGDLASTIKDITPSISDTISGFTSRGPHGSVGVVKPDVSAPGDTIASARVGSGNDVLVISGTSMAAPHTAGIAALVRAAHPGYSTEQAKAAVMNAADHDLYQNESHGNPRYGPNRVGVGRVDALAAVINHVLVYDLDTAGAVSASFGPVEAPVTSPTVTRTRTLVVENTGSASETLALKYTPIVSQPGVSYSVSPASLTVAGGQRTTATVTMTVHPRELRHTIDKTMDRTQLGLPRQYVSDASGHLSITQSDGPDLRVPVYGAAKPVSSIDAHAGARSGIDGITLDGAGFSQGGGSTAWNSLVSVMDLGAESGQLPMCADVDGDDQCAFNQTAKGGDIHYVGAGAVAAPTDGGGTSLEDGFLYFGISTWANRAHISTGTVVPYLLIDVNRDGDPDYEIDVLPLSATDLLVATTYDINDGFNVVDIEFANFAPASTDTNVFDTNTVVAPVLPSAIGYTNSRSRFPIDYFVGMFSPYGTLPDGNVDEAGPVGFDVANPAVDVAEPLYADAGGAVIPASGNGRAGNAMVLHLHNRSTTRTDILTVGPARASTRLVGGSNRVIDVGASPTLAATLKDGESGAAITGAKVTLQRRYHSNASAWSTVGTASTDGSGRVRRDVFPQVNTDYRWVYAGDGHAAAESAPQVVYVRPVVYINAPDEVGRAQQFAVFGSVKPAVEGRTAQLQQFVHNDHWLTVRTTTTREQTLPNGTHRVGYVFEYGKGTKGRYEFRVLLPAQAGRLTGASHVATVRVG